MKQCLDDGQEDDDDEDDGSDGVFGVTTVVNITKRKVRLIQCFYIKHFN